MDNKECSWPKRTIFNFPFCNSNKSSLVTIFSFSKSPGKVSYFCF